MTPSRRDAAALLKSRHPVVVYSDGIGDTLMSLPALRALSALFPGRLTLVSSDSSRILLEPDLSVRRFVNRRGDDTAAIAEAIGDCDLLMTADPDPESEFSGRLIAALAPARSLGWASNHRFVLPTVADRHFSDQVFDLPRFLNPALQLMAFAGRPRCLSTDPALARSIYALIGPEYHVLVVHADTMPCKMWPPRRFTSFLDLFLTSYRDFVALVVGSHDCGLDQGSMGSRVVPCHQLPLVDSLALVARADLFVGVDSGMLHAADLLRVPAVGIFGPFPPATWGCRFTTCRHLRGAGGLITRVSAESVLAAVESLYHETRRPSAKRIASRSTSPNAPPPLKLQGHAPR